MGSGHSNVHHFLEQSSDNRADAVAVVQGDRSWTYRQVEQQANQMAHLLSGRGVRPGNRVALLADNGIDYIVGLFGVLKAGACAVALSSANKARTNNKLLADSGAVALVTKASIVRRDLPDLTSDLAELRLVVLDRAGPKPDPEAEIELLAAPDLQACPDTRLDLAINHDALGMILYTSGSTGMPRGVTLTHGNLTANTRQILGYLDLTEADSVLVVLPFHYSFGNSLLMTHFAVGGRLVIDNRFAYPQAVLQTMKDQEVTGFSGVPSTYAILVAKTDFLETPLPKLRTLTQAGGGMAPALVRKVYEAFVDRARLFIMYGQTEASARLSYVPPERLEEKLGSIGIPIPGVEFELRRPDGSVCDIGEVGELIARGENIMQGYWNDPDETLLVLRDRELFTGDLGHRDEEGYITLVDRIKNMIKAGANRVSAKEIEDALAEIDGLVESCVVGVPDPLLGEAIEAHVAVKSGSDLDERRILAFLHRELAQFKIPRKIIFHKELPKNTSGKIMKKALKNIK
jgi:long-chain acyl-CoA synthetase